MNKPKLQCCSQMENLLAQDNSPVIYIPKFREYGIRYCVGQSMQQIMFCPWCGKELPNSLRNKWFEELDKLGLEPEDELPVELTVDSWWRKS